MKSTRSQIPFAKEAAAGSVPRPHIVVGKVKRKKPATDRSASVAADDEENCPVIRANQVFFTGRSEGGLRVVCF